MRYNVHRYLKVKEVINLVVTAVSSLKKHPGIWRVDGYNNIKLSYGGAPRVFISLSELPEEGIHLPLYREAKMTGNQIWINQPLSRISDLLIGSCWRGGDEGGGKRINTLPPMEKTYTVDTSKIRIVSLGENIELSGFMFSSVLPRRAIELNRHFKKMQHTLYAVVPVLHDSQTQFLVVSCYELYRAYIGVSSRFINNIATNKDLSEYMTWEKQYLRMRTRLNRLEQFVAYRGHCSQEGRDWFNMPSNYIKSVIAENRFSSELHPLAIKSAFPFLGRTTLTIAGKPFKNVNRNEEFVWCVFAANLLHCSKEADFVPQIAYSTSSDTPMPWSDEDIGKPPLSEDDPFDDEGDEDTDNSPNIKGRNIAILKSSNFFEAMIGLPFQSIRVDDPSNPIYENELGEPHGSTSQDEIDGDAEGGPLIPQESEFDSQIESIDRNLSDFVRMIIAFRDLVRKRDWIVTTRSYQSSITIEGEAVTTFLHTTNKRKTWHLIPEGNSDRLRQIVWVEIALSDTQFIYVMEMELKEGEGGRSTRIVWKEDFGYMEDSSFKTFMNMTAAQNKWPTPGQKWKTDKAKQVAKEFFDNFAYERISHPPKTHLGNGELLAEDILKWATTFESKLLELFQIS